MKDTLKYKNYISSVHFNAEDEVFYGKIEGIEDSLTLEGETVKALKKACEEAVNDYIEICKENGKEPNKSYKGSFNVRIKTELHKKAAYRSIELGMSLNQLVEKAISSFLSKKSNTSHRT